MQRKILKKVKSMKNLDRLSYSKPNNAKVDRFLDIEEQVLKMEYSDVKTTFLLSEKIDDAVEFYSELRKINTKLGGINENY